MRFADAHVKPIDLMYDHVANCKRQADDKCTRIFPSYDVRNEAIPHCKGNKSN